MRIIPQTHITIDGDTAWWVTGDPIASSEAWAMTICRPCDTCDGVGKTIQQGRDTRSWQTCPDCHGTGRFTFTLDVPCLCMTLPGCNGPYKGGPCGGTGTRQITVHVVEVLPIDAVIGACLAHKWPHVLVGHGLSVLCGGPGTDGVTSITLPASKAVGKYAVRLAIHKGTS
jgi:hypothetical protein